MKKLSSIFAITIAMLSAQEAFSQACYPGCGCETPRPEKQEIKQSQPPMEHGHEHDHYSDPHHVAEEELKQLKMKMKYKPSDDPVEQQLDWNYKLQLEQILDSLKNHKHPLDIFRQDNEDCIDEPQPIIT